MNGQLTQIGTRGQLRFIRKLPHPPEQVWRALTEPTQLAGWFPAQIEGKREQGAELRFVFPNGEFETIAGKMLTFEPPTLLEYTWGGDELRFEAGPEDEGTLLIFENTLDELGKAARDAAGWDISLDVLGYRLAGDEPPWDPGERFEQVHCRYVDEFGPEASTIGPPESVRKKPRRAA